MILPTSLFSTLLFFLPSSPRATGFSAHPSGARKQRFIRGDDGASPSTLEGESRIRRNSCESAQFSRLIIRANRPQFHPFISRAFARVRLTSLRFVTVAIESLARNAE